MDPPAVIVVALILCAWAYYCACLLPLAAGQDFPAPDMIRYHVRKDEDMADSDVGKRFDELFGEGRMEQLMSDATAAVWETLEIDNYPENTNNFTDVYLTVMYDLNRWSSDRYAGITMLNEIYLNSRFFSKWDVEGGMEPWVHALVYHEVTHVWQVSRPEFSIERRALMEGTADYVAMRAGHTWPGCRERWSLLWRRSWRDGYCPTMYFLRYLATLGGDGIVAEINRRRYLATPTLGKVGIVAEINRRLIEHGYRKDDFVDLLGSTPDELWRQYLDTLPADDLNNIGLLQVAGAGQAGRSKAATSTSYIY